MKTIELSSWEEFEAQVSQRNDDLSLGYPPIAGPLFRGQSNSEWKLETTLERRRNACLGVKDYYRRIFDVAPKITKKTDRKLDIPHPEDYNDWIDKRLRYKHGEYPADKYMVYLRHFGFPSPLLDWSRSSDVAAFFAFHKEPHHSVTHVAIFLFVKTFPYIEDTEIRTREILLIGHGLPAHLRHFSQQCEYTFCVGLRDKTWEYFPYEAYTYGESPPQSPFTKYTIPVTERGKVLHILETRGINANKLFNAEEGFLEAIAEQVMSTSSSGGTKPS